MMDENVCAVLLPFLLTALIVGFLAWNRYLYHKETVKFVNKSMDWLVFKRIRQQEQCRRGMMIGAVLLVFAFSLLITMLSNRPLFLEEQGEIIYVIFAIVFSAGIGIVMLLANWRWAKEAALPNELPHRTESLPESKEDSQEGTKGEPETTDES